MNSKNYISSRYYGNEATLFMNPMKDPGTSKKLKKPNIFSSFFAVGAIFLFAIFISTSVFAFEKELNGWEIGYSKDNNNKITNYTYIYTTEPYAEKDMLVLTLDHKNCDDLYVSFIIYSIDKPLIDEDEKFNISIEEQNEFKNEIISYDQEVITISSEEIERSLNRNWFEINNLFSASEWIWHLENNNPKKIEITILTEENQNPQKYLNYVRINWNINGLMEILMEERNKCQIEEIINNTI